MKVLLFVQTGDARPKALARCARGYSGTYARNVEFARQHPEANMSMSLRACTNADRWWLVECENADEGRHCIAGGCEPYRCHRADGPLSCRILASGGKQEVKP